MKPDHGARQTVSLSDAESIIAEWPDAPKRGAEQMLAQYGPPNEATPTKLFWYNNGPWKRTLVTSDVVIHNFPAPHSDYVTQWIDYKGPVECSMRSGSTMAAAWWTGQPVRAPRVVTPRPRTSSR